MSKIILHGFAPSTFVRTARMAAVELGVEHELKPLDFRSENHRALHPFAKMPILTDGETVVFETLAILAYLGDLSGDNRLLPTEGEERWRQLSAISVLLDYAYQPVVHEEDEDANASAHGVFDWAEASLNNASFIAGNKLSAADLFLAPMIGHRLSISGFDKTLNEYAALARWFSEISDRKSFLETAA